MNQLPLALKADEYDWQAGKIVKQFMKTNVLESSDTLRTLALGMVELFTQISENTKLSIIAPLTLYGEGHYYENAWGGHISIDDRQLTHIALYKDGQVVETRQVYDGLESIEELYRQVFAIPENQRALYEVIGYKKASSAVDASLEQPGGVLELRSRFFPTVFTTAKPVHTVVKQASELIMQGAKFLERGEYTQYLLLLTWKKHWVLCVRTSDTSTPLPVEGVVNEVVKVFEYDDDDQIITYMLESGFDPLDEELDILSEAIAQEILANS